LKAQLRRSVTRDPESAALICDTDALLDYLVSSAPDHERFRVAIDRARTRFRGSSWRNSTISCATRGLR
jgi:hypothetical protein